MSREPLEHPAVLEVPGSSASAEDGERAWRQPPGRSGFLDAAGRSQDIPLGAVLLGMFLSLHGRRISYAREGKPVLMLRLLFQMLLLCKSKALGSTEDAESILQSLKAAQRAGCSVNFCLYEYPKLQGYVNSPGLLRA